MIPFNKPYLSGKETLYIEQAVQSGNISGNGIFTKKCQDFVDYMRYKELTSKAKKVDQSVVDQLTEEINKNWWTENRSRFLNA